MKGEKDIFHQKTPTLYILLSSLVIYFISYSYLYELCVDSGSLVTSQLGQEVVCHH